MKNGKKPFAAWICLPWQEWMRLSFANQAGDGLLSSSITTPTSFRLTWSNFSLELSYHQITVVSLNYLITDSCSYLSVTLPPIRPQSPRVLSSSYHRLHLKSDLGNFLHSIHASILSLSSVQGQMYEASVHEIGFISPLSFVSTLLYSSHLIQMIIKQSGLTAVLLLQNYLLASTYPCQWVSQ